MEFLYNKMCGLVTLNMSTNGKPYAHGGQTAFKSKRRSSGYNVAAAAVSLDIYLSQWTDIQTSESILAQDYWFQATELSSHDSPLPRSSLGARAA